MTVEPIANIISDSATESPSDIIIRENKRLIKQWKIKTWRQVAGRTEVGRAVRRWAGLCARCY